MSFQTALTEAFSSRTGKYLLLAKRVEVKEPDTVHDFRVASRRLLVVAPLFSLVGKSKKWRRQTRRQARDFNLLRDLQVLQASMAVDPYLYQLAGRQIKSEQDMLQDRFSGFPDNNYCHALDKLNTQLAQLFQLAPWQVITSLHQAWLKSCSLARQALSQVEPLEAKSLHRLRVRLKGLRYLLELMADTHLPIEINIQAFKGWQDKLGQLSDMDFAITWLQAYAPDNPQRITLAQAAQQLALQISLESAQVDRLIKTSETQVSTCLANLVLHYSTGE